MPLYTYVCQSCGEEDARFAKIDSRDEPRTCDSDMGCRGGMKRKFEAPALRPDIQAYQSPVTGQWINSRAQQQEDLKRNGCSLNEPGRKQDIARRKQEIWDKDISKLETAVEQTYRDMHASNLI